jgi:hypothetical protein
MLCGDLFRKLYLGFRAGVFTTAYSIDHSPGLLIFTHGVLFGVGTGIGYVAPITCCMRVGITYLSALLSRILFKLE